MTTPPDGDGELTEIFDYHGSRVDAVGKGANGVPRFLIAKQDDGAAGVLDARFVRSLVEKAGPGPARREDDTVTIQGSPAAIAKTMREMHDAAQRAAAEAAEVAVAKAEYEAVIKAKYNADDLKRMAGNGQAMKDESYPIGDDDDLDKAIRAVGRGGADHDAIRRHVIKRAKALGKSSMIPDNWAADGSLQQKVSKDMADMGPELDEGADGMDPTVPLAAPDDMGPGDPTEPGSPAWESIDAATAQKWLSIAVRLKNALCVLAEREMVEAASADPDDIENAWDLQDAMCAVDFVIEQLAVFAAGEQAEAELGAEMEMIGKALASFDPEPLGVIEGLTAVRKAGRVLSSANEAAIRGAVESLQKVLASLPEAPVAKSEEGTMPATATAGNASVETVAKETAAPDTQGGDAGPVTAGGTTGLGEPRATGPDAALPGDGPQKTRPGDVPGRQVIKAALSLVYDRDGSLVGVTDSAAIVQRVEKADGDGEKQAMQAVFDQDGDLIGIVDPDAIQPVTGAGSKPADDGDGMQPGPAAAAADDMTAQPAADAGTPAEDVAKSDDTDVITVKQDVLESIIAKAVADAVGALAPAEGIAKQADVAGMGEEVETLKARLAVVENTPAAPKVFTNGAVPPAHQLRGQDQGGAAQVDVAKARERKAELYAADAPEQARIAKEMQQDAITHLEALHAGR